MFTRNMGLVFLPGDPFFVPIDLVQKSKPNLQKGKLLVVSRQSQMKFAQIFLSDAPFCYHEYKLTYFKNETYSYK